MSSTYRRPPSERARIRGFQRPAITSAELAFNEAAQAAEGAEQVGLDFVVKRGTNRYRGDARGYFTNDALESSNVPDELKSLPTPVTPETADHTKQISDYGFDFGGPLVANRAYTTDSLDAPAGTSDDEGGATMGERIGDRDSELDRAEARATLGSLLGELKPRDREILRLRFEEDLTQEQIAKQVGISQMHVSRLLTKALTKLRGELQATL